MLNIGSLSDMDCSQCSRLKSSMHFKFDLALQNIPLSKQSFKPQPQIENEDITWNPQNNMPATSTNKRRSLSLQEVRLDGWFLILHIVLEHMYHIIHAQVSYEICVSFLYYWIDILDSNQPFIWKAEIWEPFKMKLIRGLRSWTRIAVSEVIQP